MARLIGIEELQAKVALKETRIKELIKEGKFPPPVRLGGRKRAWLEEVIDKWLLELCTVRSSRKARA